MTANAWTRREERGSEPLMRLMLWIARADRAVFLAVRPGRAACIARLPATRVGAGSHRSAAHAAAYPHVRQRAARPAVSAGSAHRPVSDHRARREPSAAGAPQRRRRVSVRCALRLVRGSAHAGRAARRLPCHACNVRAQRAQDRCAAAGDRPAAGERHRCARAHRLDADAAVAPAARRFRRVPRRSHDRRRCDAVVAVPGRAGAVSARRVPDGGRAAPSRAVDGRHLSGREPIRDPRRAAGRFLAGPPARSR